MSIGKFLNPKNDLAFKRIFGTEKNKDILIHFLNDIFGRTTNPIEHVKFLKTAQDPKIAAQRTSTVDVLCEGACVEGTLMEKPIEIGRLQRYATDYAVNSGREIFAVGPSNGKSVGIVGSGPAGLSCATYLARLGYAVTIYERKPLAGGLDTYGMAEYKMSQQASLDEVKLVERLGVKFILNCEIVNRQTLVSTQSGSDGISGALPAISFDDLQARHDAVFLAIGLGATNRLNIEGEDLPGVFLLPRAHQFLSNQPQAAFARGTFREPFQHLVHRRRRGVGVAQFDVGARELVKGLVEQGVPHARHAGEVVGHGPVELDRVGIIRLPQQRICQFEAGHGEVFGERQ